MNDILKAALAYAKQGLAVFPTVAKRPVTPNGFRDASVDEATIRAWWASKDAERYGVACAIPPGVVILDIDGLEGHQALASFGYEAPATLMAYSSRASKKNHLWYRIPAGMEIRRRIKVLPSVDILVNGYALLPPTKRSDGLGSYEWEGKGFDKDAIADCPEWLLTIAKQVAKEEARVEPDELFKGLVEGERQTGMFRYACYLRSRPRMTKTEAKILVAKLAEVSEGQGYGKYPDTDKLVERVWKTYEATEEREETAEEEVPRSLAEQQAAKRAGQIAPPFFYVDGLIQCPGLSFLSGDPKDGKSLLAAYITACVTTGTPVFDSMNSNRTGCLYLDFEQDDTFAVDRWEKIFSSIGMQDLPSNLYTKYVSDGWAIDEHFAEKAGAFIASHPHVSFVVVDTLADIWPKDEGSSSSNAYHREQYIMKKLLRFAREYCVSILVLNHNRKGSSSDKLVTRNSGTFAQIGKAHCAMSLVKKSRDEAVLEITGKNVDERSINITLDRKFLRWRLANA